MAARRVGAEEKCLYRAECLFGFVYRRYGSRAGVITLTFGWMKRCAGLPVLVLLAAGFLTMSMQAGAQSTRRPRRESTANRKARIARTIGQTYGHRYEVAGGGGYQRFRSGQYQQQDNQVAFWASTMYALNPKLGVVGEVRGNYGNAKVGNLSPGNFLPFNPKISEYTFMAGPSYRFVKKEKYGVSGFVEGGLGLGKFAGDSKGESAAEIGVWTGDYAGAGSLGVSLDYNLYQNLAVRLTPQYTFTTYGGTFQHSKGVNVGVVYRFGKIR